MPSLSDTDPHLVLTLKSLCDAYGEKGVTDVFALMRIQGMDSFPSVDMDERPKSFGQELQQMLNRYNKEKIGNVPDFIIASFIEKVLDAFGMAVSRRDSWFGIDPWKITMEKAFAGTDIKVTAAPVEVELPDDDEPGGHPSV